MFYSASSPRYESRSPFSKKFPGTGNAFSKNAHRKIKENENKGISSFENKDNANCIYREILEKNSRLLEKIKLNLSAYKKNQDKATKIKAFETSEDKLKQMYENVRSIKISFDEYYTDERQQIVKDIQQAKETIELLK